MSISRIG